MIQFPNIFGNQSPLPLLPESLKTSDKSRSRIFPSLTPQAVQTGKILNVLSALSKADVQAQLGEEGVAKQIKKIAHLSSEMITPNNAAVNGTVKQKLQTHTNAFHRLIEKAYQISLSPSEEEIEDLEESLLAPSVLDKHLSQGSKFIPSFFSTGRSQNRQLHQIQVKTENGNHYISSQPDMIKDSKKLLKDMRHFTKTLETVLKDKTISESNQSDIRALVKEIELLEKEIHGSIQEVHTQTIHSLESQLINAENAPTSKARARLEAGEQIKEVIRFALAPDSPLKGSLTKLFGSGSSDNREIKKILKMNFLEGEPHQLRFALEVVDDVIRERALQGKPGVSLEYAQMHQQQYPELAAIAVQLRLAHEKCEATQSEKNQGLAHAVRIHQVSFQAEIASKSTDLGLLIGESLRSLPHNAPGVAKLVADLKAIPLGRNATSFDELFLSYQNAIKYLMEAVRNNPPLATSTTPILKALVERLHKIAQRPCDNFGDDLKTYGRVIGYHHTLGSKQKEQLFEALVKLHHIECAPVIHKGKKFALSALDFPGGEEHADHLLRILQLLENDMPITKGEFKQILQQIEAATQHALDNFDTVIWDKVQYGPKPDYRSFFGHGLVHEKID